MIAFDKTKLEHIHNSDGLDHYYLYDKTVKVTVTTKEIAKIKLAKGAGLKQLYSAIDAMAIKKLRELL